VEIWGWKPQQTWKFPCGWTGWAMTFGNKVVYRAMSSEIIIEKLNTANNIA